MPTSSTSERAFTLLEVLVALAVVVLAAGLLLPRLADLAAIETDAAARRLAGTLTLARERAVLGGRTLDEERGIQWFAPRRPRSGWARSNKERVARLEAAGLMLPAGRAAVDEAKRNGTWTLLDDVENLVVPDDLAGALDGSPPARTNWDAFPKSARRAMLGWVVQARRPETRAERVERIAAAAVRGERAYPPTSG